MLNLIAADVTYLFPGGRTLKLVKDGINVTDSTNPVILTKIKEDSFFYKRG